MIIRNAKEKDADRILELLVQVNNVHSIFYLRQYG